MEVFGIAQNIQAKFRKKNQSTEVRKAGLL